MSHGPGTIIVPCQELARYHRFTMSLASVEKPERTQVTFGVGMSITDNLNTAIRSIRDDDEWVWILGDDHFFDPNTLMRLLDRNEDVVAPLCCGRAAPFSLMHWQDRIMDTDVFEGIPYSELPIDGEPFEVERSGSLMLIRRNVLDAVGDPWYGHTHWRVSEDLYFCESAKEAGFRIMVDPQITVGHIGNFYAYPQLRDGVWGFVVDYQHGYSQFFPGGLDEHAAAMGRLEPALA